MRNKCHITLKATHHLLNFEDFFIRTLQFFLMRLVCVGSFVKQSKNKATYYYKEDMSSMLIELFPRTFFACFALRLVFCFLCKANERKRYITINKTHRLLKLEVLFIRTLQFFDMRFVCVGCFVEQSRKKRHVTIRKTSSMLMEGLFSRTFLLALLCVLCVVCFLKQMREKCHITLKTTHRLL